MKKPMTFAPVCAAAAMAGCRKYDDSAVRNRLDKRMTCRGRCGRHSKKRPDFEMFCT
ncbi:MAG: hypothetical protein LBU98_02275 [Alistipes sp.]|nr:hypothetical protein [Alistipes sp.]